MGYVPHNVPVYNAANRADLLGTGGTVSVISPAAPGVMRVTIYGP